MPTLPRQAASLTISNFDSSLEDRATCDLSRLTFVDAYGLVGTACSLRLARSSNYDLQIKPPTSPGTRAHLAAMGFASFVRELGFDDLPTGGGPAESSGVVVPLRSAADSGGEQEISKMLWEQLHSEASPQILEAIGEGVWEMVANALEHSDSDAAVMGQVYGTRRGGQPPDHNDKVQVVIGDVGRGIRDSLTSSPEHDPEDDLAAIDLAMQYLVSSVHDDPGRGQGLSTTMEQVLALGGRMIVRSGSGRISLQPDRRVEERVPPLSGTIVGLSLPLYPG